MSGERRDEDASVVRHEDELQVEKRPVVVGAVRATKAVDTERVIETVSRQIEDAEFERVAPREGDSGEIETLPDGSVSIPLFEEELVVTKRLVVRERVVIRKRTTTETERVRAELRKEQIELDTVGDVELES